jgi:hypothetical protein
VLGFLNGIFDPNPPSLKRKFSMNQLIHNSSTVRLFAIFCALIAPLLLFSPASATQSENALMRLDLTGPPSEVPLPVHAVLQDAGGNDYVLVLAAIEDGLAINATVLDSDPSGAGYLVALERRRGAREAAADVFTILLDDGRHVVVRNAPGRADVLAEMGFDLALFSREPWIFPPEVDRTAAPAVTYDSRVADIIAAVTQTAAFNYEGNLSGETAVTIEGSPYTIVTRHTASGEPIQKATQYVFEFMSQFSLDVSFHNWASGRNVIGEKLGATDPDEIVLVTAHLDDMPIGGIAPGADDNASGSVGVMLAAELFDSYWFEKTIRFVFFTGEEQGLLGAQAYATKVQLDGDNIVAVFNMDMIGYDAVGGPTLRIHTRNGYAPDLAIANTFVDVVSTYGLSGVLTPIIDQDGMSASDHAAFWAKGYAGVLAIEDDQSDFNAYYHTVNDTRDNLNMTYLTNYIKASLGSAAHLGIPTTAPCEQNMMPLEIDLDLHGSATTSSNENGILERGERVMVAPTWQYPGTCSPELVTGQLNDFSGPAPLVLSVPDDGASYGLMTAGEVTNCYGDTGNCYEIWISPVGTRPSTHVDLSASEDLSTNRSGLVEIHLGESFNDVGTGHWAYGFIETTLHHGITNGCTATTYCPDGDVTRWQMAVFLSRAMVDGMVPESGTIEGMGDYDCSPGGQSVFGDVPPTDSGCSFVHYIAAQEVTSGCATGSFCPSNTVDRWQMAVFLAKATTDPETIPFSGTVPGMGDYDCSDGGQSVFADVAPTDPACRHIHFMAVQGITAGCGGGNYCPGNVLARDQMAVFLTKAFNLFLNGISVQ